MSSDRRAASGFESPEAERLFVEHVPLADRLARRFSFGTAIDDDLRQVAHVGLLLACRRFDPARGVFARFASVTITGELKKHFRSNGWGVRVPRSLQEDSITVFNATERLTARLSRSPSLGEVADHTGFERERVAEAIRTKEARFSTSIEHYDIDVVAPTDGLDAAIIRVALERLPEAQQQLIRYQVHEGLTQAEIGRLIGISQPQVHRRLAAAMKSLRAELEEQES